ncbi:hypothetical protein GCM10010488_07900 [Oerskovia jenensis]
MDDDVVGAADEAAAWLDAWGDRTDYEAMGVPELARAYVEHLVDLRGDRAARLRALDAIGVHDEVFSRLEQPKGRGSGCSTRSRDSIRVKGETWRRHDRDRPRGGRCVHHAAAHR